MADPYINPLPEQIAALRDMDLDGPIVMLNLLRFAADGAATYARYMQAATPFLERSGARVRYLGNSIATVIGGETWDEVILVEYPSVAAFLQMVGDPDYPSGLRTEALIDSRLYCTQPTG